MSITSELRDDGVRVVTMEHPPVNALTVQGWYDVAAALDEASRDMDTHAGVLRAEGRGGHASTPARNGPTARIARATSPGGRGRRCRRACPPRRSSSSGASRRTRRCRCAR